MVFPRCRAVALGVYPIVPSAEWVQTLRPAHLNILQLRIEDESKGLEPKERLSSSSGEREKREWVRSEVRKAVALSRESKGLMLFINDYWDIAIEEGAYGVHLGQEDLDTADLGAIKRAGLRLGTSTHTLEELDRIVSLGPSYIAVGPMFQSQTKPETVARYGERGESAIKLWRERLKERDIDCPLVAIGGITAQNAPGLVAAGADGLAVINAIVKSEDPLTQIKAFQSLYAKGEN